ncbi:MAG: hypothetical protein AAGB19_11350 [Cyanobacteria bacterium P01_F01_bin.3]
MNSDLGRLAILLSILLLIAFPFFGFAPLTLLFFVGVAGWGFRLVTTIIAAAEAPDAE